MRRVAVIDLNSNKTAPYVHVTEYIGIFDCKNFPYMMERIYSFIVVI